MIVYNMIPIYALHRFVDGVYHIKYYEWPLFENVSISLN